MAKLNLDYYNEKNHYSDGDIENDILAIASSGQTLEELGRVEFPVLYHLSRVRENILNWYPFRTAGTCLEIGAGCGAISGLLCRRMEQVVAVDISKRRASINYARHKELDNLEIMVGNLNDMKFTRQFDYIVLNGVFEYAMSFTPGEQPYQQFLKYVAGFLKPDGVILVAIENRLGLKYFAGAPEDHTNAYMDGLRGYPGNDSVRTFSKAEWQELMNSCGLNYHQFYYPYPDYKFPTEIFTDETIVSQKYGRKAWNFTEHRFELFPQQEMAAAMRKEGVMTTFANSFLIEMSSQPLSQTRQILYAKLNTDRRAEFAISTVLERRDGVVSAVKEPLTAKAAAHLQQMAAGQQQEAAGRTKKYQVLPGNLRREGLAYPFLKGHSLGYEAEQAISSRQPERVKELVRDIYEHCLQSEQRQAEYDTEAFRKVFGSERLSDATTMCVSPANIDLILDNIMPEGEQMWIIDPEWIFPFPVPAAFLIWRTINELYGNCPWLEEQLPRQEFMMEYEIDPAMEQVFWSWATHFTENYVGANGLAEYAVPEVGISLEELRRQRIGQEWFDTTLYVDTGSGFSEAETIKQRIRRSPAGTLEVTIKLTNTTAVKALRFDPLEGNPCRCELRCAGVTLKPLNASGREEGRDLFLTTDPAYQLEWSGTLPDTLKITGHIEVMDKDQALQKCGQLRPATRNPFKFWR